jgi:hypothetical protein
MQTHAHTHTRTHARARTERQQGLAAFLLNQVALMQAAAYTLMRVAAVNSWRAVQEPQYELVPFSRCCSHAPNLPQAFAAAVRAWGQALGQPAQQGSTVRGANAGRVAQ